MKGIIVDDEPLAREAIQLLTAKVPNLEITATFSSALAASKHINETSVDLIFLDIEMPGMNGIEFAKTIPEKTLVIFTTAYPEYALDGFELDAIDYLIKPVKEERFQKAVNKAITYHKLLEGEVSTSEIQNQGDDYFFVKSERKFIKIYFKDILFIEGLKDYVVMQTDNQRIMTAMNIKTIHDQLPQHIFVRIGKSYVINIKEIASFDNNTVMIRKYEIPIGNTYRNYFFDNFITKKVIGR
ncbi:two component transcriptional regulator, LytTR family [Mucilaginibacter mallensis]|uniref:Two component transcriptional regulator, LytTR family n=1 Tax=Mucilaginibacter mallensis TaxID=652787 RepID=A0A1H2BYF9_MUCMA|nr:LytTR family DNA-binding domain-containing protein [Mucilaginibacter mallensis]SDT63298.1 two component transcriptional regulator, LytTR family [Mucilaginibacter mallensis]